MHTLFKVTVLSVSGSNDLSGAGRKPKISAVLAAQVVVLLSSPVFAAGLDLTAARGSQRVEHVSPSGLAEACIVSNRFHVGALEAKYETKRDKKTNTTVDKDLLEEQKLCALDFYAQSGTGATAVCVKDNSTNPGIALFKIPDGMSKAALEVPKINCEPKDSSGAPLDVSKVAKFKQSISCSNTSSILGYYHLSRILGNVGNVPPAVLRTMDLTEHHKVAVRAQSPEIGLKGIIAITWGQVLGETAAPSSNPNRRDLFLTSDLKQSYGALSENPKKEKFYSRFFIQAPTQAGVDPQTTRAQAFKKDQEDFKKLQILSPASQIVGVDFTKEKVQQIVAMKDISDMLVMDYIMGQKDRMGNIAAVDRYYVLENKADGTKKLSTSSVDKDEPAPPGAVVVQEMMLKDNDCGMRFQESVMKNAGMLELVSHMDRSTYQRVLALDSVVDTPDAVNFFKSDLNMNDANFKAVRGNIKYVANLLKSRCDSGNLLLDLDVEKHFARGGIVMDKAQCQLQPPKAAN